MVLTQQAMYQEKDRAKSLEIQSFEKSVAVGIGRIPTSVKNFCHTVGERTQLYGWDKSRERQKDNSSQGEEACVMNSSPSSQSTTLISIGYD